MIKVSVLYPSEDGKKFDMSYYTATHIPMVKNKLGAACKRVEVDAGLGGAGPGTKPPYVALAHMYFDSVDAFQNAFGPHADTIMSDIPNYTDIQPVIQVSDLKS